MREVATDVLSALVVEVLKPGPAGQWSECGRVLIQDGSSLAVHSGLRREYPGRFTAGSPAAVEWHVTWDLCREQIEQVMLTPDTFTERAELPVAASLREVSRHGGQFVVRAQRGIKPVIEAV